MTATRLQSPCRSCDWTGDRDREDCLYCQGRIDFLSIAFGDPWHDVTALRRRHEKDKLLFAPKKRWVFGPGPNARRFTCPICGAEVETSLWQQKTCAKKECSKAYERQADAARKLKNRDRDRAQNKKRKREKRAAGMVV